MPKPQLSKSFLANWILCISKGLFYKSDINLSAKVQIDMDIYKKLEEFCVNNQEHWEF